METKLIEAGNGFNHGKFMVARFDHNEWNSRSALPPEYGSGGPVGSQPLVGGRGWGPEHIFVMDLQTGEGATFRHGGYADYDLEKHRIWTCPLFLPFLRWLYKQPIDEIFNLPSFVAFTEEDAPSSFAGSRGKGREMP